MLKKAEGLKKETLVVAVHLELMDQALAVVLFLLIVLKEDGWVTVKAVISPQEEGSVAIWASVTLTRV